MLFAYSLCIILGLILGSFQILRGNIVSNIGPAHNEGSYTDEERALSGPSILLLTFGSAAYAAVFYDNPWVIVDNFVTGKDAPLILQFSVMKFLSLAGSIIIGELLVGRYQAREAAKKQDWAKATKTRRAAYQYKADMEDWRKWRRQTANSGHPDWTRPNEDEQGSETSQSAYADPLRVKQLRILGLNIGANAKEVRKQYLKMAKAFHPDRLSASDNSPDETKMAEDKMKDINAAYNWLKSNP